MDILNLEAHEIAAQVKTKKLKAVEVTECFLKQSEKMNPKLNAFVTIHQAAVQNAKKVDDLVAAGKDPGRLAGVPVAIKDMLCTKGIRTTAGSKILHNFIPPYSATVVEKIENEGGIVIGKANQDEFAMGSTNETSYFGKCANPWDLERVPGGSSGGSAAAVAARMAPLAIGTDTGGSIRQPSSFTNLVGVKPTYSRVSRYGIVAYASSLDQAGPMARSVKDAALMMESICGFDPRDATSSGKPVPNWSQNLNDNLKGIKIGRPKEFFTDAVSADTQKVLNDAIEALKSKGAEIVDVTLPHIQYGVQVYYLVATSEASSNLARYDGVRFGHRADFSKAAAESIEEFYSRSRGEGFGAEVKRRILIGTFALSSGYYDAYYKKSCQVRNIIRQNFLDAYKKCDVIFGPVSTTPAYKLGEKSMNPLAMYMNDIFTIPTNLAGLPGMSVPGGFSASGLPIGVQITAPHFEEQKMLNVALAIENVLNAKKEKPNGI